MDIVWRGPVPESNFTVGRGGDRVELIVDHWTVVTFEAAVRRFKNPASILSAHYVIGQDGRIAQLVREDDTAYYAGIYAVNQRSEEDRRKLNRVYDHLEAYEPLVWTTRLQRWLGQAIRSVFPNADLSGPDVETGQPFDPTAAARR